MLSSPSVEIIRGLNRIVPAARYPNTPLPNRWNDILLSNKIIDVKKHADSQRIALTLAPQKNPAKLNRNTFNGEVTALVT